VVLHALEQGGAIEVEVRPQAPGLRVVHAAVAVAAQLAQEDARAALEERPGHGAEHVALAVLGEAVQQQEGGLARAGLPTRSNHLGERQPLAVRRVGEVLALVECGLLVP
jgi:hypothetical protein